ncbi:MAG: 6-phospho-beta-glucosidase [Clostridia bacterium BRH_c25]|nr:MAG: 6-phospho-beta-glucosidase [Clostridia bacterium BRH_c25]
MKGIKIVVIGGGSSYTPELADGIIRKHPVLPVSEIVLVDINDGKEKCEINTALLKRMFAKADLNTRIHMTLDRGTALTGADFVITQFRVGGLEARAKDESIPVKYDMIGQETTGPGGFAKALRTIPVMLEICRDMEYLCPDAWLINFTNPSGIVTEAVLKHSGVKCIGLCNVPINMKRMLEEHLGADKSRLHCRFTGLNHLSVIKNVYLDGRDVLGEILESPIVKREIVSNIPSVDFSGDFLSSLGFIPSPYLRYYYFEKQLLAEEKEKLEQGHGTRAREVMEIEKKLFEMYQEEELDHKPAELSERGGALYSEAAVELIDSIWNNKSAIHIVNVPNGGAVPELPQDCIIETNCIVNREGAVPLTGGSLPEGIIGLIQHAKAYECLTIEAAVSGSKSKALAALINNPLVHDVPAAIKLLHELLEANNKYLPQFHERR